MDNKDLKENKLPVDDLHSSLKWSAKKKKSRKISEKTSFPKERKEILAASDKALIMIENC